MSELDRRTFLGAAGFAGLATVGMSGTIRAARADPPICASPTYEWKRQAIEALVRSYYSDKDNLELARFVAHYASNIIYEDATAGLCNVATNLQVVQGLFAGLFASVAIPGRFSKFTHAAGDVDLGAIAESVDLENIFTHAPYDSMAMLDITGGKFSRNTDYWDSAQLSEADIFGPVDASDLAFPVVPVHPGGPLNPRYAPGCSLYTGDNRHATPDMLALVARFHGSLTSNRFWHAAEFFTEDAVLIHPLFHPGGYGYGAFDRTIQVRGAHNIFRILKAGLALLPDGANSTVLHVVGDVTGGGYEWRAGGEYATRGLDRQGIRGITSIDLFGEKIQRMSVKFDTIQMTAPIRERVISIMGECL